MAFCCCSTTTGAKFIAILSIVGSIIGIAIFGATTGIFGYQLAQMYMNRTNDSFPTASEAQQILALFNLSDDFMKANQHNTNSYLQPFLLMKLDVENSSLNSNVSGDGETDPYPDNVNVTVIEGANDTLVDYNTEDENVRVSRNISVTVDGETYWSGRFLTWFATVVTCNGMVSLSIIGLMLGVCTLMVSIELLQGIKQRNYWRCNSWLLVQIGKCILTVILFGMYAAYLGLNAQYMEGAWTWASFVLINFGIGLLLDAYFAWVVYSFMKRLEDVTESTYFLNKA